LSTGDLIRMLSSILAISHLLASEDFT